MQDLRANTQVIVTIGPFVDVTDGFTPETGITLGAADEAELMKHGSTTVVDISGATWAAVTGMDGYYSLTLTTSHTDTEGQLTIVVQDASVCLPVKNVFKVLSEAAYDSLYVAKDDGFMDVNVKTIGRTDTDSSSAIALDYWANSHILPSAVTSSTERTSTTWRDGTLAAQGWADNYPGVVGRIALWIKSEGQEYESSVVTAFTSSTGLVTVSPAFSAAPALSDICVLLDRKSNVSAIADVRASAVNLETACSNYSATRGLSGTALPAAAADGAGGLPVSDLGNLDLDTILDVAISSRLAASSAPANFGDLAITVTTGQVTVGTNNDKTGYSISGTKTTLDALNDITTAQVNTEVDTALTDIGLHYLISSALPTSWAADVTANSVFDYIADDGTAVYDRTTDSLQAIADSGGGDATAANQTTIINNLTDIKGAGWVAADNLAEIAEDVTGLNGAAMRGTDNAALASVLGALTDATAAGDPTSTDTVMAYTKQLINTLEGTTGIPVFPAESAPGNNVSLAEIIRAIHTDVTGLNGATMRGTDNALLAASAPTNFGDLAITVTTGQVTVGTNNDKTGYSISGTLGTLDALDTQQDLQHAQTQSDIAALNNLSAAQVNTEVDTALADIGLDHLISSALPTNWATDVAANSVFDYIADDGTAAYDRTTDSLQAIADSGGGGPTAGQIADAVWDELQSAHTTVGSFGEIATEIADILTDTANMQPKLGTITNLGGGATIADNLSDMAGSTFLSSTDSLEAIRDRGDAAWTTGAGGSDRLLMVDTTISSMTSQTQFIIAAGSGDNNAYRGCTIIIEDVATATQKAIGIVDTYTGSTREVTLLEDPGVFTMAPTDKVYILAEKGLKPTTANDYHVDVSNTGTVGIDWGNVDNQATSVNLSSTTTNLVNTTTTNTDMRGTDSALLAASAPTNWSSLGINGSGHISQVTLTDTTTTNTDMRGTDNAALASVLGALTDAAAAGDPTSADTTMAYVKQLINTLEGTAGIPIFPAEAAPANAVSLAEVIRAIHADVTGLNGDAMRGTDSALLASSAPANFGDLAITVTTGQVTVGTNNDKTGYSISGTKTTLDALNDVSTTQVNTEVDTALADIGLDHLISSALPTNWATDVATNSVFDYIADDGTAAYDRTTDSLQAIADSGGGGPTAGDIADAVWDELQSAHVTAGTFGEIATEIADILTDLADIKGAGWVSTDNLAEIAEDVAGLNGAAMRGTDSALLAASAPTNWSSLGINVSGHVSRVTLTDTTTTNTDVGSLNDLSQADIRTAVGLSTGNLDTQLSAIDSVVDQILDDTGVSGVVLTSGERNATATALLDLSNGVETSLTVRQALRLASSVLGGKVSGMDTNSPVFRDSNDTVNRVLSTTDADGNRSVVTLNL